MQESYRSEKALKHFITEALKEDLGNGDHSSLAAIPADAQSSAKLLIKDKGILAGVEMALAIFNHYDPNLTVNVSIEDGSKVKSGDIGFTVTGSARSILACERLVLNCMQRMSGIATYTAHLNSLIGKSKVKLLDTRKTTPNFRIAEKWAVAIGGGNNHRFGLYDMIMLKDNHIDFAGGIEKAILATQEYLKANNLHLKIEVETRSVNEVEQVLQVGGVDIIMLDNMTTADMKKAVELINGRAKTEASGGITEETIADVAQCGVDYISVGALTHSVTSLDISLKAKN